MRRFDVPLILFKAQGLFHEPFLGWRSFTKGDIEVVEVAGDHYDERDTLGTEHVGFVASRLRDALERRAALR